MSTFTPSNTGPRLPLASTPVFQLLQDKHRLIAEIGKGGMATVYLAVNVAPRGFHKLQVIKRLRPALAEDPGFLTMFLDEARLAARLSHPNVVQSNEVGYDGQNYFIAMEYLEGQSLEAVHRHAARNGKELPLVLHLHILSMMLEGLHYAHELSDFDGTPLHVVHRDVSPQNVMIAYSGHVKVLDFGIAKAVGSANNTKTGVVKGKYPYMAPEQFGGGGPIDRRADVFGVGVMLWQCLVGRRMWEGLDDLVICGRLATRQVPPLPGEADIDPRLKLICSKALAPDPEDRYATAEEMRAQIEDYLATLTDRGRTAQLGAFVSELFAERRLRTRALIEDHLKSADHAETTLPLPRGVQCTPAPTLSTANKAVEVAVEPARRPRITLRVVVIAASVSVSAAILAGLAVHFTERNTARASAAPSAAERLSAPGTSDRASLSTMPVSTLAPSVEPVHGSPSTPAQIGTPPLVVRSAPRWSPTVKAPISSPATSATSAASAAAAPRTDVNGAATAPSAWKAKIIDDTGRIPILEDRKMTVPRVQ